MPFVNVRTARGLLGEAEKARLHAGLTQLLVDVEGRGDPDFARFVLVLIEEHEPGAWSAGGERVTEAGLRALAGADREQPVS